RLLVAAYSALKISQSNEATLAIATIKPTIAAISFDPGGTMFRKSLATGMLLLIASPVFAQTPATSVISPTEINDCLRTSVAGADDQMTVAELREACTLLLETKVVATTDKPVDESAATSSSSSSSEENNGGLRERLAMEALNRSNRFTLTPHKRNFILPISYKDRPHVEPYIGIDEQLQQLDHTEAEFQLSIKILLREGIFDNNGHLFLGYTNHTMWQVYTRDISAPFREPNQEPELILSFTNDWEIFGFRNVLNEGIQIGRASCRE